MSTKWFLLTIVTFGIYRSRVYSRLQKWIIEHQEIDPATPVTLFVTRPASMLGGDSLPGSA